LTRFLVTDTTVGDTLQRIADCGMAATTQALWVGYIGVGGGAALAQVDRWFAGSEPLPYHEHNLLARDLNDWLIDGGSTERVPYADALGLPLGRSRRAVVVDGKPESAP